MDMKTKLLVGLGVILIALSSKGFAQCVPNNDTVSGIEPDTLAVTYVGVPYNEVIYFRLPEDTIVDFVIGTDTIPLHVCLDSLTIDSIHGLAGWIFFGVQCAVVFGARGREWLCDD
jgi:hypothetical protein